RLAWRRAAGELQGRLRHGYLAVQHQDRRGVRFRSYSGVGEPWRNRREGLCRLRQRRADGLHGGRAHPSGSEMRAGERMRLLSLSLVAATLLAGPAAAQLATGSSAPVDITADELETTNGACTSIWRGHAEALQE